MAASLSKQRELFLLMVCLSLHLSYGFEDGFVCSHKPPKPHEVITHVNLNQAHRVRRQNLYQNLRIRLFYDSSIQSLPEEKQLFINTTILPQAVQYWHQTLMVQSTGSPIRLNRKCQDSSIFIKKNSPLPFCKNSCEQHTKCGEVIVPEDHLERCRVCGNDGESCREMGGLAGPGISDSDFVLYVSAIQTERCDIGRTIAYAAHCQLESALDRPVAGHANLCPESISTNTQEVHSLLSTVKHEILHALGFSVGLYGLFRDDKGVSYTPRGEMGLPIYNESLQAYAWSNKVIQTVLRKDWKVAGGKIKRSVQMLVTPRVKEEVRKHFNCPTLEGAELEDQGLDGTSWTHWEKRIFENEAMTGTHTQHPVFSRITLALMEDTGWYKANYSMAQPLAWGKNLGCDFVKKSCKDWMDTRSSRKQSIHPFCNRVKREPLETECTDSRDAVALCNLVEYVEPMLPNYQNFDHIPNVPDKDTKLFGGSVSLADYCPYIQEFTWKSQGVAVRGSRCEYPDNNPDLDSNFALEYYGSGSKCFHHDQQWVERNCEARRFWQHWGTGCYKYMCTDGRLHLEIANRTITCYYTGQRYQIQILNSQWLHIGSVICPCCQDLCQTDDPSFSCLPENKIPFPSKRTIITDLQHSRNFSGFDTGFYDPASNLEDITCMPCPKLGEKGMICLNQTEQDAIPQMPVPDDLTCKAAPRIYNILTLAVLGIILIFI